MVVLKLKALSKIMPRFALTFKAKQG